MSLSKNAVRQQKILNIALAERERRKLWEPLPGPQVQAIESEADELFYGGQAGGGKTDLLLGVAITKHKKAIIFRREYPQLKDVVGRSREMLDDVGAKFNGMANIWRDIPGDRTLEFGAVQYEKDKNKYKGRAHDLKGFDEITEFTKSQYEFLIGWARTVVPEQRVRVITTGNPPTDTEGRWVIERFAPWLDDKHPNPAEPGELRWFAIIDGESKEVGPDPFEHNGETITPKSRTFIPAALEDNPYLEDTDYRTILQGLPEPLRSQLLYGDFTVGIGDNPWQVIPTEWVRAAQARWKLRENPEGPLLIGVDIARGGDDNTAIAKRYSEYIAPIIKYSGKETPDGPSAARYIMDEMPLVTDSDSDDFGKIDESTDINLDIIAVGGSVFDFLEGEDISVNAVNFAEGSTMTDKTGKLKMRNKRAEAYWSVREALDPTSGNNVELPPDNELLADLCSARWKLTTSGVLIESKEDIIKRLGRSPDIGDAVALTFIDNISALDMIAFIEY